MTTQITIEQALELVDFVLCSDGTWCVAVVKGDCGTVEGDCGIVKGSCGTVKGECGVVKGDCGVVKGRVYGTICGCQWQYVETPKERLTRLIEEDASKEELLKALEELND